MPDQHSPQEREIEQFASAKPPAPSSDRQTKGADDGTRTDAPHAGLVEAGGDRASTQGGSDGGVESGGEPEPDGGLAPETLERLTLLEELLQEATAWRSVEAMGRAEAAGWDSLHQLAPEASSEG